MNNRKAFSLVEMLVAVILISMLIGVAVFSFRYQLVSITKMKKVGINKVLNYHQLRSSLQSMKYYVVDEYDMLNNPMKKLHFYFYGTLKEMDYITTNPLFSKDIAVVNLKCIDGDLLYKEEPLYKRIDILRPKVLKESRFQKIYTNLKVCRFSYYKKGAKKKSLIDDLPDAVEVHTDLNDIYVDIQSDFNRTLGVIKDAIYPPK